MKFSSRFKKNTAIALSLLSFFTNAVFADAVDNSLWSERARQGTAARLARAPETAPISSVTLPFFPSIRATSDLDPQMRSLLDAIPPASGRVGNLARPTGPGARRFVIHIEDIHMNAEAQRNIAGMIGALLRRGAVDVVALEGAFVPLALKTFREFPDQEAVRRMSAHFIDQTVISGAVGAALIGGESRVPFVGVDDARHYRANVEAYRRSSPLVSGLKRALRASEARMQGDKERFFSPRLRAFDRQVEAYRDGTLSFGAYASFLCSRDLPSANGCGASLEKFIAALALEKEIDFGQADAERLRVLEQLAKTLTPAETSALVDQTAAFRDGGITHEDYYAFLARLCHEKNVRLSSFPAFHAYIRYVTTAGSIDAGRLFAELNERERALASTLAVSPDEKRLVAASRRLRLTGKLVDFSLTPEEWNGYREGGLGDFPSFESFYVEAHARDEAMTRNFLRALERANATTAVLVTGGFHAGGIDERLRAAGVSVVTVAPRITRVEEGSGSRYLGVFLREKTPVEKLFEAPRLFVSPVLWSNSTRVAAAVEAERCHANLHSEEPVGPAINELLEGTGSRAPLAFRLFDHLFIFLARGGAGVAFLVVRLRDGLINSIREASVQWTGFLRDLVEWAERMANGPLPAFAGAGAFMMAMAPSLDDLQRAWDASEAKNEPYYRTMEEFKRARDGRLEDFFLFIHLMNAAIVSKEKLLAGASSKRRMSLIQDGRRACEDFADGVSELLGQSAIFSGVSGNDFFRSRLENLLILRYRDSDFSSAGARAKLLPLLAAFMGPSVDSFLIEELESSMMTGPLMPAADHGAAMELFQTVLREREARYPGALVSLRERADDLLVRRDDPVEWMKQKKVPAYRSGAAEGIERTRRVIDAHLVQYADVFRAIDAALFLPTLMRMARRGPAGHERPWWLRHRSLEALAHMRSGGSAQSRFQALRDAAGFDPATWALDDPGITEIALDSVASPVSITYDAESWPALQKFFESLAEEKSRITDGDSISEAIEKRILPRILRLFSTPDGRPSDILEKDAAENVLAPMLTVLEAVAARKKPVDPRAKTSFADSTFNRWRNVARFIADTGDLIERRCTDDAHSIYNEAVKIFDAAKAGFSPDQRALARSGLFALLRHLVTMKSMEETLERNGLWKRVGEGVDSLADWNVAVDPRHFTAGLFGFSPSQLAFTVSVWGVEAFVGSTPHVIHNLPFQKASVYDKWGFGPEIHNLPQAAVHILRLECCAFYGADLVATIGDLAYTGLVMMYGGQQRSSVRRHERAHLIFRKFFSAEFETRLQRDPGPLARFVDRWERTLTEQGVQSPSLRENIFNLLFSHLWLFQNELHSRFAELDFTQLLQGLTLKGTETEFDVWFNDYYGISSESSRPLLGFLPPAAASALSSEVKAELRAILKPFIDVLFRWWSAETGAVARALLFYAPFAFLAPATHVRLLKKFIDRERSRGSEAAAAARLARSERVRAWAEQNRERDLGLAKEILAGLIDDSFEEIVNRWIERLEVANRNQMIECLAPMTVRFLSVHARHYKMNLQEYRDFLLSDVVEGRHERLTIIDRLKKPLDWERQDTYFFRDADQWELAEFLGSEPDEKKSILYEKWKNNDRVIRIRHMAASTGEEPYSFAITLYESLERLHEALRTDGSVEEDFFTWLGLWDIRIDAFDAHIGCLLATKEGVYSKEKMMKNAVSRPALMDLNRMRFFQTDSSLAPDLVRASAVLRKWMNPQFMDFTDPVELEFEESNGYDVTASLYTAMHIPLEFNYILAELLFRNRNSANSNLLVFQNGAGRPMLRVEYAVDGTPRLTSSVRRAWEKIMNDAPGDVSSGNDLWTLTNLLAAALLAEEAPQFVKECLTYPVAPVQAIACWTAEKITARAAKLRAVKGNETGPHFILNSFFAPLLGRGLVATAIYTAALIVFGAGFETWVFQQGPLDYLLSVGWPALAAAPPAIAILSALFAMFHAPSSRASFASHFWANVVFSLVYVAVSPFLGKSAALVLVALIHLYADRPVLIKAWTEQIRRRDPARLTFDQTIQQLKATFSAEGLDRFIGRGAPIGVGQLARATTGAHGLLHLPDENAAATENPAVAIVLGAIKVDSLENRVKNSMKQKELLGKGA